MEWYPSPLRRRVGLESRRWIVLREKGTELLVEGTCVEEFWKMGDLWCERCGEGKGADVEAGVVFVLVWLRPR